MAPVVVSNPLYVLNKPPLVRINQNKSRRNLSKANSRGSLLKTYPVYNNTPKKPRAIKTIRFSNGSRPGNNINNTFPRSTISMASEKIPGAYVVPPDTVANTYTKMNYNRRYSKFWSLWGGGCCGAPECSDPYCELGKNINDPSKPTRLSINWSNNNRAKFPPVKARRNSKNNRKDKDNRAKFPPTQVRKTRKRS